MRASEAVTDSQSNNDNRYDDKQDSIHAIREW
jgi:hypothetical protein